MLGEAMRYTIVAIDVKRQVVSFTDCPDWDSKFEPSLGQCLTVNFSGATPKVTYRKASTNNPQIYHRRYLFVDVSTYAGFDYKKDIDRVVAWSALKPDATRMGRRDWWDDFCKKNGL